MTEAKLKELQQINDCKCSLKEVLDHLDNQGVRVSISVEYEDITLAVMHAELHPRFLEDLDSFLWQQYNKYKEAFDNA
jgi:hypothetical protein